MSRTRSVAASEYLLSICICLVSGWFALLFALRRKLVLVFSVYLYIIFIIYVVFSVYLYITTFMIYDVLHNIWRY